VDQTRLKEDPEYTARREDLRLAEIELMRQREHVASLRRQLPAGTQVEDYVFDEGPRRLEDGDDPVTTVSLSELFAGPGRPLVIYHLMYGKAQTEPCPMCTMWIDGFNGVADHLAANVDSPSPPRRTSPRSGRTLAPVGGPGCGCSAAPRTPSNTIWRAKTVMANRIRPSRCSPRGREERFSTAIPRIRGWPMTSTNGASTCCALSGIFSTSRRGGEGIGTRNSSMGRDGISADGEEPQRPPRTRPLPGPLR